MSDRRWRVHVGVAAALAVALLAGAIVIVALGEPRGLLLVLPALWMAVTAVRVARDLRRLVAQRDAELATE